MAPTTSLLSFFLLSALVLLCHGDESAVGLREIDLANPIHGFTSLRLVGNSVVQGNGGSSSFERVHVVGLSRFKIRSYASSFHIILKASDDIPESHHSKLEVCFHGNASLGLGQCNKDDWSALQNGQWAATMSPYADRYLDVKFASGVSGSITISVEEEFQQWRLISLAFGFTLLVLAPIVSSWVPFYYSSSMVLGVLLVILIILFQGMKLLPTGRKSFLYLTLYGSILGAGSFLVHYFSVVVNSILVNFGLDEEMHNPVSVFLLVGITLAGAALGYWVVRKFVLSEDGTVDVGIAQFVKWAMRIFGVVFILQFSRYFLIWRMLRHVGSYFDLFYDTFQKKIDESTLDSILAVATLTLFWSLRSAISLFSRWLRSGNQRNSVDLNIWELETRKVNRRRAEFLSRSPKRGSRKPYLTSPDSPYAWSSSPSKGLIYSTPGKRGGARQEDYYSTFHRTPARRRFSKKEWDSFTREATREALAGLASTPDFSSWIAENAHRIHLTPEQSSDDGVESSSDSSEATTLGEGDDRLGFFGRFMSH